MASRRNFPNRVQQRREDAAARQAEYDNLTTLEKLARAFQRHGTLRGHSSREMAKLEHQLTPEQLADPNLLTDALS